MKEKKIFQNQMQNLKNSNVLFQKGAVFLNTTAEIKS
jgi:hypothetical protein